jgi:hypothetical protein
VEGVNMNTTENTFVEKKVVEFPKKGTMRKLNLEDYTILDTQGVLVPYKFKETLTTILTHPNLGLNAVELLEATEISEKIEKETTEVLLTEDEYKLIVELFKRFRGFSKGDVEMVKRVWDCPVEE